MNRTPAGKRIDCFLPKGHAASDRPLVINLARRKTDAMK